MADFEHQGVDTSNTLPKFNRWVLAEGLSQSRKNLGVIIFAILLHISISALFYWMVIDARFLQQLSHGFSLRALVLETIFLVVGMFAIAPVLMATHVSLIKGISNWAAITSKPLKEWDQFVGVIVFWAIGGSLIFALPRFWAPFFIMALSIIVFTIFSILIATWMPSIIYGEKVSFRRVLARGKKTFWYVFSRLIIFVLFAVLVSAIVVAFLTPIIQALLPTVQDPELVIFMVNNGGTAVITSSLVPILSVICVRAYVLGEAHLQDRSVGVAEADFAASAD